MLYPNIEVERMKLDMTKEDFSKTIGVTSKTYSNWQKYGNIPADKLLVISKVTDQSLDYLLGV